MLKQYHLKEKMDVIKNELMPYSTSTPLKSENIVRSFNSEILIIHSKKTTRLNTNLRLTLLFFKFENRIKAKVHGKTKKLQSFMHFTELDLSGADCLMRAARFIQTYYEEFTPYLQVAENNEDNEKVGFQFGIYKNGYKIENQLFYIMISKKPVQF
ncbi:YcdB/YcdC domain-containing protein [Kurthia sp. Dielmo]|uniref:YcdB/YcdC domain-containing protein n=1 Tax=Kurthia sp. Dielmo TaxID=1033738 RepID=UPI00111D9BA8|nr:YcdB/YcdC domain-containing protein [Kurthia sp. Dielmo]